MPGNLINTHDFHLVLDEALRQNACQAVEHFLKDNQPVKNAQLHGISGVVQAKGLSGLRQLIENQKSKNTKKENRAFWEFMADVILKSPGPEFSLRAFLQSQPQVMALLEDETGVSENREKRKIRRANKAIIDQIMEQALQIYFEHFNCHYFYKTRQGVSS